MFVSTPNIIFSVESSQYLSELSFLVLKSTLSMSRTINIFENKYRNTYGIYRNGYEFNIVMMFFIPIMIWRRIPRFLIEHCSKIICGNSLVWFGFIIFSATFNKISAIWWRSVLLVEEPEKTRETVWTSLKSVTVSLRWMFKWNVWNFSIGDYIIL